MTQSYLSTRFVSHWDSPAKTAFFRVIDFPANGFPVERRTFEGWGDGSFFPLFSTHVPNQEFSDLDLIPYQWDVRGVTTDLLIFSFLSWFFFSLLDFGYSSSRTPIFSSFLSKEFPAFFASLSESLTISPPRPLPHNGLRYPSRNQVAANQSFTSSLLFLVDPSLHCVLFFTFDARRVSASSFSDSSRGPVFFSFFYRGFWSVPRADFFCESFSFFFEPKGRL